MPQPFAWRSLDINLVERQLIGRDPQPKPIAELAHLMPSRRLPCKSLMAGSRGGLIGDVYNLDLSCTSR